MNVLCVRHCCGSAGVECMTSPTGNQPAVLPIQPLHPVCGKAFVRGHRINLPSPYVSATVYNNEQMGSFQEQTFRQISLSNKYR